MAQSGRFEIGVHSYDMHGQKTRKGSAKNKGESTGQYQAVFRADTEQCVALLASVVFLEKVEKMEGNDV